MEKIIPGGYYSYDSANRKLWLSYEYYNLAVENIDIIKNLTSNKIMYSAKNPQYPISVENGCITHSYPSAGANTDKIQIVLRTPIVDSLTELEAVDGVVTLETDGKVLVLPTSNAAILPSFNQSVLDPNRLTIAESPFGGLKGSGSPDYAPGTLNVISGDGIYLQDINGQNSTKTLTAGKLAELGHLTVDTAAHTITEEFILRNDSEGTDVQVIDACDSASGWTIVNGTGTITIENGRLKCVGTTDASGKLRIQKTFSIPDVEFITIDVESVNSAGFMFYAFFSGGYKAWYKDSLTNSFNNKVVFPIKCITAGSTGRIPNEISGTPTGNPTYVYVGLSAPASTQHTFYLDNITACNGTWAQVEVAVPDFVPLNPGGVVSEDGYKWELKSYNPQSSAFDRAIDFNTQSNIKARWMHGIKFMDGTTNGNCYGWADSIHASGLISYAMGDRGSNTGLDSSSGGLSVSDPLSITYSSNYGTQKRIGFAILMPPSDNGRTGINQCRLKLVTYYDDENGNLVKDLSGNGNNGTIVGGVTKLNDGGLQFDGSTGYIIAAGGNSINVSNNVYICLEFTPVVTLTGSGAKYILSKYGSFDVGYGITSGMVKVIGLEYTTAFAAGTKYKLEGFYNGTTTEIKIDNVSVASGNVTLQNTSNDLRIGGGELYVGAWRYSNIIIHDAIIISGTFNIHYKPTSRNMGATTYEFSPDTNTSTGLQNVINPWIAIIDPSSSEIDFYLFTHRPKNLSFKRNESGQIYEVTLYPGNGLLYHGQIYYSDVTRDTDSNDIPDCLEASLEGSLTKFLQSYGMVI